MMNFTNTFSKIFSVIIIVTLFVSPIFFTPKKAEAQYAVTVVASVTDLLVKAGNFVLNNISKLSSLAATFLDSLKVKEYFLDGIAKGLVTAIRRGIVQSTLAWVRSGFQGSPAFIQNPKAFFTKIADNTIGNFIYGSDLRWMCSPFKLQIQRAIIRNYSFYDTNQCSLTQIINNFQGFTDSVGNELGTFGGWDTWAEVAGSPSNNPFGAYALAGIQIQARVDGELNRAGKQWELNKGFLSWKDPSCVAERSANRDSQNADSGNEGTTGETRQSPSEVYEDAAGNVSYIERSTDVEACPILTPGSVIVEQLNKTLGSEIDELVAADEINEAVTGMILSLVQQALGGNGGLAGSGSSYGGVSYSNALNEQDRLLFSQSKDDLITQIIGRVDVENQYISVKNQSIGVVDISAEKIRAVIDCYSGKIATSSSYSLSPSDISFAQSEIRSASTTFALIKSFQTGITRDIAVANSNITSLNRLSDSVSNLSFERREQMSFLSQQFSTLFSKVHSEADISYAQQERDYTLPDRLKDIDSASDRKYSECIAFPRSLDTSSSSD